MANLKERLVSKDECKAITQEIQAAVADIFASHGMEAPTARSTYGDIYKVTLQSTPVEEGVNGINVNSPEAQTFLAWPGEFGLEADHLGGTTTFGGKTYVFLGVKAKSRTRPLLFKEQGGTALMVASPEAAKQIKKAS